MTKNNRCGFIRNPAASASMIENENEHIIMDECDVYNRMRREEDIDFLAYFDEV